MSTKESKVLKEYYQTYVGKYEGIESLDEYYWSITDLKRLLLDRITEGDFKLLCHRCRLNHPVGTHADIAPVL